MACKSSEHSENEKLECMLSSESSESSEFDSDIDQVIWKNREVHEKGHVSNWDKNKISGMNIRYNDNASEINDIFQMLRMELKEIHHKEVEVPKITSRFIEMLKEIMDATLSFDLDCVSSWDTEVMHHLRLCEKAKEKIEEIDEQQLTDVGKRFLLHRWTGRVFDFYTCYQKFLVCCFRDKGKKLRKSYVDLLKDFTRIFFLDPEDGECRKSSMKINGVSVTSMPDIRYSKTRLTTKEVIMFSEMIAEVKNYRPKRREMRKESMFDINAALSDHILGQHAGGLLLESFHSYFSSLLRISSHYLTFGMICIKTQIIFTCMKLETDHMSKIMNGDSVNDEDCVIKYTRPFNFLRSEDREEIMEHLLLLGFLQQDKDI